MNLPSFSQLSLSLHGSILLITITHPPSHYLTGTFYWKLNNCREIILSDAVDVVVLTGEGKLFSKGFDIHEVLPASSLFDNEMVLFANDLYSFFADLNKPVIAAINGTCLGGGLELAMASLSDFVPKNRCWGFRGFRWPRPRAWRRTSPDSPDW